MPATVSALRLSETLALSLASPNFSPSFATAGPDCALFAKAPSKAKAASFAASLNSFACCAILPWKNVPQLARCGARRVDHERLQPEPMCGHKRACVVPDGARLAPSHGSSSCRAESRLDCEHASGTVLCRSNTRRYCVPYNTYPKQTR